MGAEGVAIGGGDEGGVLGGDVAEAEQVDEVGYVNLEMVVARVHHQMGKKAK